MAGPGRRELILPFNYFFMLKINIFILLSCIWGLPQAQDKKLLAKQHYNIDVAAVAIKGYDPVAYFNQHKALKGKKEWAISHQGVLYYFSSAGNKEAFRNNPAAYEPQYGGWCAYAMGASGEKVPVDPETFKIINGKLFLFYNRYLNNTLTKWNREEQSLHLKANNNWNKLFK